MVQQQRRSVNDDAERLYALGCDHVYQENYEEACSSLSRACELEPENTEYLNVYAVALMECGNTEQARTVLLKLVELAPNTGHEKYLYLGQIQQGEEAVSSYHKGIQLLQQQLDEAQHRAAGVANGHSVPPRLPAGGGDEEDEEDGSTLEYLQSSLSAALCALAEHYLSTESASDSGVAQVAQDVEQLAQRAVSVCPVSAEPQQVLATLRHLQGRREEALHLLRESVAKWLPPAPKSGNASPTAEQGPEMGLDGPQGPWPPFQARLSAAKLLLELDDSTDLATQVCETCLLEDEDSVEATYVMALALYSGGNFDEAESCVDDARIMAHEQGLLDGSVGPPEGAVAQLIDQLQDLEQAIQESRQALGGGSTQ